jgi:hypothetical protein
MAMAYLSNVAYVYVYVALNTRVVLLIGLFEIIIRQEPILKYWVVAKVMRDSIFSEKNEIEKF